MRVRVLRQGARSLTAHESDSDQAALEWHRESSNFQTNGCHIFFPLSRHAEFCPKSECPGSENVHHNPIALQESDVKLPAPITHIWLGARERMTSLSAIAATQSPPIQLPNQRAYRLE